MYRTDAPHHLQKIERLERELNLAYEEQFPTANDAEVGLALLRFRAQRLARDVESFRAKHQPEPLWKRLKKRVTRVGLGLGFVAGACVASMAWSARVLVIYTPPHKANARAANETPPPKDQKQTTLDPAATALPTWGAAPAPAPTPAPAPKTVTLEPSAWMHVPLSPKDYKQMLARSEAFFRAVRKRDGQALAELTHPTDGLALEAEQLSLTQPLLRDCFTNRHLHTIPVSFGTSSETIDKTCGDILWFYADTPYARSPDVMFNGVPSNVAANDFQPDPPYVFFYLPPGDFSDEHSWQGVTLSFARYGDELLLTRVTKQSWKPGSNE